MKATERRKTNLIVLQGDGTAAIEVPRGGLNPVSVIVDALDVGMIRNHYWRAFQFGTDHCWYARAGGGRRESRVYMHRLLCGGRMVDHVNGNTLDNRRSNLRPVTSTQNNANKRSAGGASKYKGVWAGQGIARPWSASIGHNYRRIRLGQFATEEEAARAYDQAALDLWGEYACLNFPGPGQRGAVA